LYKKMHLTLPIIIFATLTFVISNSTDIEAQSIYSPFYVNETAEAEKNRIEYITYR